MAEPMLCPVDRTPLVMSERQSIEIDYCPTCRGVWLDRGELDKIIERSAAPAAAAPRPADPPPQNYAAQTGYAPPPPGYGQQGYGHSGYGHHPHGKRKKSFLEELFD